jgi:hypothetical protein
MVEAMEGEGAERETERGGEGETLRLRRDDSEHLLKIKANGNRGFGLKKRSAP